MNKLVFISIAVIAAAYLWYSYTQTQKVGVQPLPTTSTTASPEAQNLPEDWQRHQLEQLDASISLPPEYLIEETGQHSLLFVKPMTDRGVGPTNFLYASLVTQDMRGSQGEIYNYSPDQFEKLVNLEVGESASVVDDPSLSEWYIYTRVDDVKIDGITARRYENNKLWEFPPGTSETRFIFEENDRTYLLGYYTGGDTGEQIDPREAFRIISSTEINP